MYYILENYFSYFEEAREGLDIFKYYTIKLTDSNAALKVFNSKRVDVVSIFKRGKAI